jgi:hypothetical protein
MSAVALVMFSQFMTGAAIVRHQHKQKAPLFLWGRAGLDM